jgi:hypothetical protein
MSSEAISATKELNGIAWGIFKGIQDTIDRQRKRYKSGILYPKEDRNTLVTQGKIPPIYSVDSIVMGLNDNRLPPDWSPYTTVLQGFAKEVNDMEKRLGNELILARQLQQEKIDEAKESIKANYKNKVIDMLGRKKIESYKL